MDCIHIRIFNSHGFAGETDEVTLFANSYQIGKPGETHREFLVRLHWPASEGQPAGERWLCYFQVIKRNLTLIPRLHRDSEHLKHWNDPDSYVVTYTNAQAAAWQKRNGYAANAPEAVATRAPAQKTRQRVKIVKDGNGDTYALIGQKRMEIQSPRLFQIVTLLANAWPRRLLLSELTSKTCGDAHKYVAALAKKPGWKKVVHLPGGVKGKGYGIG